MAFRTGSGTIVSLDRAFEQIENLASSIKNISQGLLDRSAADNMDGNNVIRYFTDLGNFRLGLEDWVAKLSDNAAANAYAQERYNDLTYNAQTEYTAMRTEINNTLNFIQANIPTDLLAWDATNGVVTWNTFTAGATVTLRTQLQALIDTID